MYPEQWRGLKAQQYIQLVCLQKICQKVMLQSIHVQVLGLESLAETNNNSGQISLLPLSFFFPPLHNSSLFTLYLWLLSLSLPLFLLLWSVHIINLSFIHTFNITISFNNNGFQERSCSITHSNLPHDFLYFQGEFIHWRKSSLYKVRKAITSSAQSHENNKIAVHSMLELWKISPQLSAISYISITILTIPM